VETGFGIKLFLRRGINIFAKIVFTEELETKAETGVST
jgi:hypothetical protein